MGQAVSIIAKCVCGDQLDVEERLFHQLLPHSSSTAESNTSYASSNQLEPKERVFHQGRPLSGSAPEGIFASVFYDQLQPNERLVHRLLPHSSSSLEKNIVGSVLSYQLQPNDEKRVHLLLPPPSSASESITASVSSNQQALEESNFTSFYSNELQLRERHVHRIFSHQFLPPPPFAPEKVTASVRSNQLEPEEECIFSPVLPDPLQAKESKKIDDNSHVLPGNPQETVMREPKERVFHQVLPPSPSAPVGAFASVFSDQLPPKERLVHRLVPPSSPDLDNVVGSVSSNQLQRKDEKRVHVLLPQPSAFCSNQLEAEERVVAPVCSNPLQPKERKKLDDNSHVLPGKPKETVMSETHRRSGRNKQIQPTGKVQVEVERPIVVKEKRIKHYTCNQKILLVGEGDFSFSACLAEAFGSAANMVATSLNSFTFLTKNYGSASDNIQKLMMLGCEVCHEVDATKIGDKNSMFKGKIFDRIIFNFPHAGFSKLNESREVQIREHQKLVRGFLKNAKKLIRCGGEIHISHKTSRFHREWNLDALGTAVGLRLLRTCPFKLSDYPGYNTKYGFGGDRNFKCNPSKTFKFALPIASPA